MSGSLTFYDEKRAILMLFYKFMKKKLIYTFLMAFPSIANAFSLENSDIRLLCPQRGQIEVILHRYQHTQESWGKSQFETGGGHARRGPLLMIQFANLDQMLFNQTTKVFSFWYAGEQKLVNCQLLGISGIYPSNIPYHRE